MMKNEIKVGDKVMVVTQHGESEVCHALEKGSVVTVVNIHESGVVVQGESVLTGNDIRQFLGHDEVKLLVDGCDFCNGTGDFGQWFLNPHESLLCFDVNEFLGINYCPMCGKKLKGGN